MKKGMLPALILGVLGATSEFPAMSWVTSNGEHARDKPYHLLTAWAKEKCRSRLVWNRGTYRCRHLDPTIRGKLKIKAAKRARVKAMKKAQATRESL